MSAKPQHHTPRGRSRSWGSEVGALADELGLELLPWQKLALDVILAHKGRKGSEQFLRPEAICSLPRQSGKSVLMLLLIAWWGLRWQDQTIILVAPDRGNAARRLEWIGNLLLRHGHAVRHYRGSGNERLEFVESGSQAFVVSASRSGGHGESPDLALIDESWSIGDETHQALIPAQAARPRPLRLQISTAGDEDSTVWNSTVERGRLAAADRSSRTTYVEYSIPDGADPFDSSSWKEWHPAIGHLMDVSTLWDAADAFGGVGSGAWLRAYGNISTRSDQSSFARAWIDQAMDVAIPEAPTEGAAIGIDVSRGPESAAVAVAWIEGEMTYAVLVSHQMGISTRWVRPFVEEILEGRHPGAPLSIATGPVIVIKPELEDLAHTWGVELDDSNTTDLAGASMRFYEGIQHGTIRLLDLGDSLREAMLAARPRKVGERWVFDRDVLVDQSPLIATINAVDKVWLESLVPEVAIW